MGDLKVLKLLRWSSFLPLQFSPLLGLRPPATLSSRLIKRNSAPFSELSAVDPCSSCGPYTCSSVTNACQQTTTTTTTTTTAAATTAAETTAAETTAAETTAAETTAAETTAAETTAA